MHNSKIYSVLQYFDKIEQNRLRKYIVSPYFNKNEALIQLFERLVRDINRPNGIELTKEKTWSELYADKPYDDVRFRKLCSDLLKLVEGFLAQEEYQKDSMHQANFLMEAVIKRKLSKLFQTCINTSNRLSKKYPFRAAEYFHHQYKFQSSRYALLAFETQRTQKSNIEEIIQHLDKFYLGEKLKLTCDMLSRKALGAHDYQNLFIEEITEYLSKLPIDDAPPVEIYYQSYLTYTQPEKQEHYFKLKKLIQEHGDSFPSDELETLYGSLQNYCIKKVNLNAKKTFMKKSLDLYKELLKKQILLTDGELSPWQFKNIVFNSLRLSEFEWTENFIKEYKPKLPAKSRESAVSFNLARLRFYQKNYEEVISLLSKVEYEDISYNLGSKTMLLATYYETDEIEPLYSLMDSFRAFIRRKKEKLPKRRIDNYLQLINFVKKLTKIRPGDAKAIQRL